MTNTEVTDSLTLFGSFTSSSSYKPMLYLALARLPFSFRTVNLKYGAQKETDYLAVNRYGQVPALRHRGLTIVQSNVILDYLARTTGHFAGSTEQEQWTAREWLVGDAPTIADIGCWGRMVFMAEGGLDISRWPNVAAWSRRLAAMPGFALPYDLIPKRDREVVPG